MYLLIYLIGGFKMEKVKVTQEVFKAIENYISEYNGLYKSTEHFNAAFVAEHVHNNGKWDKYQNGRHKSLNKIESHDLMLGLLSGFEVIEEEKLEPEDVKKLEGMTVGQLAMKLEGDILHTASVDVDLSLVKYIKHYL